MSDEWNDYLKGLSNDELHDIINQRSDRLEKRRINGFNNIPTSVFEGLVEEAEKFWGGKQIKVELTVQVPVTILNEDGYPHADTSTSEEYGELICELLENNKTVKKELKKSKKEWKIFEAKVASVAKEYCISVDTLWSKIDDKIY